VKVRGSFRARGFGLLATSGAAHLIIFASLGLIPSPAEVLAREMMEFEVYEPPEVEEPPPPPPEPEPPKEPPKEVTRKAPKAEAEPPPEEAPPPAQAPAEEVADFTGTTLVGGDGAGWSTAIGTGGALKGPVGKIGGRPGPVGPQQAAKTGPAGPRVVPLASLSRKPSPPVGLDDLLKRNYPSRAQMQGVEGRVVMEVRLLPSGRVGEMRVVEEFPPAFDFASECRKTLRAAPPFSPGLDKDGNPVATDIKFTCSFVVAD
jgi:TonB family protein